MAKKKSPMFDRPQAAYLKYVAKDPEFIERSEFIKGWFKDGDDNHITLGHDDGKPSMIVGDENIRRISQSEVDDIIQLAKDFDISLPDAVNLMNGIPESKGSVTVSYTRWQTHREPSSITISIGRGATKQEIIRQLESIDELIEFVYGDSVKKDKGPENYPLVYAIHKARLKGMKFKDIYRAYQDRELDQYKGKPNIQSVDKLKQYYYKYRPHSALPYPITPENVAEAAYILQPELKKNTT